MLSLNRATAPPAPHSFPTRRSSDLRQREPEDLAVVRRAEAHGARTIMRAMKIGIVVPYSWSFWGGVVEHAELQADALKGRSEEHTSELQSLTNLVCRLLLEKKKEKS